jgi:aerobic C4-dicarboxylate transport protein
MAFTIGRFGLTALLPLATLMLAVYITMALFVIVVLGAIVRLAGFSVFALLRTLRDELLLVLGTSSTETMLPQVMEKLLRIGCSRTTVGLVVPTGYSFNQDWQRDLSVAVGVVHRAGVWDRSQPGAGDRSVRRAC